MPDAPSPSPTPSPAVTAARVGTEALLRDIAKGYEATALIFRRLSELEDRCEGIERLELELGRLLARVDALEDFRARVVALDAAARGLSGQ